MSGNWAGYTRVSRVGDRAETLISPDLQADRIRHYAEGRGLDVELLPPELDQSGGKVDRPILSEAIEGVESGRFAGIIVAQLDRLSRMDIADALHTIKRIESAGGEVIAVAENFDQGTPEGRMARNVLLALGEMQLDRYRRQFREAKASAVRRGISATHRTPVGYRRNEERRLEPDPRARKKVVRAFEARAAGKSWRQVAAILEMGITSAGKVIRNRVYLGELHMGEFVNTESHAPLISRDLWEAAQISHPRPARGSHEQALLVGLLRCAGCRGSLTADMSSTGRNYRCRSHKAAGTCQAPAIISQRSLDPYVEKLALAEIDRIAYTASERTDGIDEAEAVLRDAELELGAYQEAVRVSEVGPQAFAAGMRSRDREVQEARRALAKARLAASPTLPPGNLRQAWPSLTTAERRTVLGGALGVVWVRKGRGPLEERVRVIAAGFEPPDLPGPGRRTEALIGLDWVEDLEGEVRPSGLEDAA